MFKVDDAYGSFLLNIVLSLCDVKSFPNLFPILLKDCFTHVRVVQLSCMLCANLAGRLANYADCCNDNRCEVILEVG